MTRDVEVWLGPMFEAMASTGVGKASFARLMERAVTSRAGESPGVDWVVLGQLLRAELGWDDYPSAPVSGFTC
jgi:hypothetical protein